MHQYYFEQFILAIKSAGFINSKLINSQNALDFSYVVYLKLVLSGEVDKTKIKDVLRNGLQCQFLLVVIHHHQKQEWTRILGILMIRESLIT